MAFNSLVFPNHFTPISTKTPSSRHTIPSQTHFPSHSQYNKNFKSQFPLPAVASVPYQPINVDYFEEEFMGHGVSFEGVGENCVAKMELENGSIATLLLPSGLVTSYKAFMWHGGTMELLHTAVSERENGAAAIQGGVSLDLKFQTEDGEVSWSPSNWALQDIKGTAQESIQIELINREPERLVELKYLVALQEDALISELRVSNSKPLPLQMAGSILSHLTVSTPEATFAIGLERSTYFGRPPFASEFCLGPPELDQEKGFGNIWNRLFPGWGKRNEAEGSTRDEDINGEEMDSYKPLKEKLSLVYTDAPHNFSVIDRGRRNSVTIGREGFDEIYLCSPGSNSEMYSKYSYICIGQSAVLKPILINPTAVWRGVQHIHNPNL